MRYLDLASHWKRSVGQRQLDDEHRAAWLVVFDSNIAAVAVDQHVDEVETNSRPAAFEALLAPAEDLLLVGIRDTGPVVGDADGDRLVVDGGLDGDLRFFGVVVLDSIFQEVPEDGLQQIVGQHVDSREIGRDADDRRRLGRQQSVDLAVESPGQRHRSTVRVGLQHSLGEVPRRCREVDGVVGTTGDDIEV